MKLLRFGAKGSERPGLLDASGGIRDLSGIIDDVNPATLATQLGRLRLLAPDRLPLVEGDVRIAETDRQHRQAHLRGPELR